MKPLRNSQRDGYYSVHRQHELLFVDPINSLLYSLILSMNCFTYWYYSFRALWALLFYLYYSFYALLVLFIYWYYSSYALSLWGAPVSVALQNQGICVGVGNRHLLDFSPAQRRNRLMMGCYSLILSFFALY